MPELILTLDKIVEGNEGVYRLVAKVMKVGSGEIRYSLQLMQLEEDRETVKDREFLRYDNYRRHGHHKHILGKRYPYEFVSVEKLIRDFNEDARKLIGVSVF